MASYIDTRSHSASLSQIARIRMLNPEETPVSLDIRLKH
jgi:hypothetical protein